MSTAALQVEPVVHADVPNAAPSKRSSHQLRALFRKSLSLQARQKMTLCCQVIFPLVLILFLWIMQLILTHITPEQKVTTRLPGLEPLNYRAEPFTTELTDYQYFWFVDSPSGGGGMLTNQSQRSGLLGAVSQWIFPMPVNFSQPNTTSLITVPYFEQHTNTSEVQSNIEKILLRLNAAYASDILHSPLLFSLPDGAAILGNISTSSSPALLTYDTFINDNEFYQRVSPSQRFNRVRVVRDALQAMLDTAYLVLRLGAPAFLSISQQGMPYKELPTSINLVEIVGASLFPFAIQFLLPVYISVIVMEKEKRLREMMKMMGMEMKYYWLVSYVFNFALYIVICVVFVAAELLLQCRFFTQTSPLALILLFVLWGTSQIALAYLLSVFFRSASTATIVGYLLVIISVIAGDIFNAYVYAAPKHASPLYMLWPPFAFYRGVYLMFVSCANLACFKWHDITFANEIATPLVWLAGHSIVVLLLALYLDAVVPQEHGVALPPLFFLRPLLRLLNRRAHSKEAKKHAQQLRILDEDAVADDEPSLLAEQDSDVRAERERVIRGAYSEDAPVVLRGLTRIFRGRCGEPDKVAVRGLHFVIERNECFGLLGPNGSGKTTTIGMLTGLLPPTRGQARVGGHDIRTEMAAVRGCLGVCPQFDVLWEDLTCLEHLLFYARLKGLPIEEEESHARELLRKVNLADDADKLASQLSGGMKRRLSVAISLCGNPLIVILDEPTTGLDPVSKRQLWGILAEAKTGRSMLLTTHSMEEADVLSNRIGIISLGRLRCIGAPLHLKHKFGLGYRLTVLCINKESGPHVEKYIQSLLPKATQLSNFEESQIWQVPSEGLDVGGLMVRLEKERTEVGIREFGIGITSLEDVFCNIVGLSLDT